MVDTASAELPKWPSIPIRVPAIPHNEITSDVQFLSQAAEWIVGAVRLADIHDGTVDSGERGRAPVEEHVLGLLITIYKSTRETYERKD